LEIFHRQVAKDAKIFLVFLRALGVFAVKIARASSTTLKRDTTGYSKA